jgi:8-oxo-dGTP pyrophosphatase MutT (NUDIX family)
VRQVAPAVTAGVPGGADLFTQVQSALLAAGLGPPHLDSVPADDPEGRTLAAALVLLYPYQPPAAAAPTPHLVLTLRTTAMRRHSGQISLPGGRYDQEDGSLLRTALRETEEELGVNPASLTVWGRLEPEHIVASHYALASFVGYTSRRPSFRPAPAEVAEVIDVPLAHLLDPATVVEEDWDFQGFARRVCYYRYGEHKIWGATARILSQLVALLAPAQAAANTFLGAGGEGARGEAGGPGHRLAPGDTWPPSMRPPAP